MSSIPCFHLNWLQSLVISCMYSVARLPNVALVSIVIMLQAGQTLADALISQIRINPTVPGKFLKLFNSGQLLCPGKQTPKQRSKVAEESYT